MQRRFWQFVHDRLERAWHWVYRTKLASHAPVAPFEIRYIQMDTAMRFEPKLSPWVLIEEVFPYRCDACGANWSDPKPFCAPHCPACGSVRTVAQ